MPRPSPRDVALVLAFLALLIAPSYPAALFLLGLIAFAAYRHRQTNDELDDMDERLRALELLTKDLPALKDTVTQIKNRAVR